MIEHNMLTMAGINGFFLPKNIHSVVSYKCHVRDQGHNMLNGAKKPRVSNYILWYTCWQMARQKCSDCVVLFL